MIFLILKFVQIEITIESIIGNRATATYGCFKNQENKIATTKNTEYPIAFKTFIQQSKKIHFEAKKHETTE